MEQHYIPKFYMQNFYVDDNKHVFDLYDVKRNKWYKNKGVNTKKLFSVDDLYENCNIQNKYIETNLFSSDWELKVSKKLQKLIPKIKKKKILNQADLNFLRNIGIEISLRNPSGVNTINQKFSDLKSRSRFFDCLFSSKNIKKKNKAMQAFGYFSIQIYLDNNKSILLGDVFSITLQKPKDLNNKNKIRFFPLSNDILIKIQFFESKDEKAKYKSEYVIDNSVINIYNKTILKQSEHYVIGKRTEYPTPVEKPLQLRWGGDLIKHGPGIHRMLYKE